MSLKLDNLDKQFLADRETTDVEIGENFKKEPIIMVVAPSGNPEHEKVQRQYAKLLERYRRNQNKQRKLYIEIIAKSILVGWKGVIDDDGNAIPCTVENKIEILTRYREVLIRIMEVAGDITSFQEDDTEIDVSEETEKN